MSMNPSRLAALASITAMSLAGVAAAQQWNEVGNAGGGNDSLGTPNIVDGSGPLTSIVGVISNETDNDSFVFQIDDPTAFSASVTFSRYVSRMYLVNAATLESYAAVENGVLSGAFLPSAGEYMLVVTTNKVTGVNDLGVDLFDFSSPSTEVGPNPAFGSSTLASYTVPGFVGFVSSNYTVTLTGASFIPAPGAAGVLGAAGLLGLRRRRA